MFRRGILPTLDREHMPEGIECSVGKEGLGASAVRVFEGDR